MWDYVECHNYPKKDAIVLCCFHISMEDNKSWHTVIKHCIVYKTQAPENVLRVITPKLFYF